MPTPVVADIDRRHRQTRMRAPVAKPSVEIRRYALFIRGPESVGAEVLRAWSPRCIDGRAAPERLA